jgi:hypothetical protein
MLRLLLRMCKCICRLLLLQLSLLQLLLLQLYVAAPLALA